MLIKYVCYLLIISLCFATGFSFSRSYDILDNFYSVINVAVESVKSVIGDNEFNGPVNSKVTLGSKINNKSIKDILYDQYLFNVEESLVPYTLNLEKDDLIALNPQVYDVTFVDGGNHYLALRLTIRTMVKDWYTFAIEDADEIDLDVLWLIPYQPLEESNIGYAAADSVYYGNTSTFYWFKDVNSARAIFDFNDFVNGFWFGQAFDTLAGREIYSVDVASISLNEFITAYFNLVLE